MEKNNFKILCIDDHRDNLISLKALIREAFPDAITLTAENGPDGIKLALSEDPNVILLDVVMPGMDGFEVCQKLKSDPKTSDIPVVFITALKGDKDSRIRALEVGAEAFLAKPIDETELTAQIRAMQKIKAANSQKRFEKQVLAQRVAEQTRELEQAHTATLLLVEDLRKENETRKQNETALRESEERFRLLFESMESGFALHEIICDAQGAPIDYRFLEINPAFEKLTGLKAETLLGHTNMEMLPGTEKEWIERYGKVALTGEAVNFESYARELGKYYHVIAYSPKFGQFAVIFQDITARKQAEEALRENQMMLINIIDSVPQNIFWKDLAGLYLGCNENFAQTVGLTRPDQIIGKTDYDLPWPRAAADAYRADDQEVISRNLPKRHIIEQVRTADGIPIWVDTTKTPLQDAAGKPYGVLGVYEDITERKQTEEALRDNELALKKAQQVAHVGSWAWHISQDRLEWSDEMYRIFGIEKAGFSGKLSDVITNAIHPDDRAAVEQSNSSVIQEKNPIPLEYRIIRPDGTVRVVWAEAGELILNKDGQPEILSGIVQDITERKQAEETLRDSAFFIRETQRVGNIGSYKTDFIKGFWESSEVLNHIFGIDPNYDRSIPGWLEIVHPDDREKMNRYLQKEVILKRKPFDMEYRIIRKNDGETRWVHGFGEVDFDKVGNILSMIGTIQDITERKVAEQKNNEQLEELRRWYSAMLGREKRTIELKKEVNDLLVQAGQPPRYSNTSENLGKDAII